MRYGKILFIKWR